MKTLYAGPWVGELGWEIFGWQGAVRAMASDYDRVIVGCRPGHEALYRDFADGFRLLPSGSLTDRAHCEDQPEEQVSGYFEKAAGNPRNRWLQPQCFPPDGQRLIKYGKPDEKLRYDVVIHARRSDKFATDERNWPFENWCELATRIAGLKTCSIGLAQQADYVPGTVNHLGVKLAEVMDMLASSRLIVGPTSGPIHLAALCGTPTVVWTNRSHIGMKGMTNESRLREQWNPFRVPVDIIDGWQPSVDAIHARIMRALDD